MLQNFEVELISKTNNFLDDSTVAGSPNIIRLLRPYHDGCNRRYSAAIRRGRYRITIGYILDSTFRVLLYSSLSPSARILVCRSWHPLLDDDSVHVPPFDSLFHHQLERRLVGNPRGSNQEI